MYQIPIQTVRLSGQTITLNKGTAAKIIGNCRNLSSNTVKAHTKQSDTFSDIALRDAAQAIAFVADTKTLKKAHAEELAGVSEALAVLKGYKPKHTSHPLVEACIQLKNQVGLVAKSDSGLQSLDFSDAIDALEELQDGLQNESETISNRYQKTLTSARKGFGSAVARAKDVGAVAKLLNEAGTDWQSMLPAGWDVDVPEGMEFSKATFNPASKIGGHCSERNASVVVFQVRAALAAEAQSTKNKLKTAKAKLAGDVIAEIGALLKGAE
jgi:hypothetical protein